jgi:hypothetical protein
MPQGTASSGTTFIQAGPRCSPGSKLVNGRATWSDGPAGSPKNADAVFSRSLSSSG